jgi:hypothetical protein
VESDSALGAESVSDDGPQPTARPAWRDWPVGARVVVRARLEQGGYSDALGILVESGADGVAVATRRGRVEVKAPDIAIGKLVSPPAGLAPT